MISSEMRLARFDGIENPTPMLPDCESELEELLDALAIATLMPMSLP